jgi:hypothetical protein
MPSSASLTPRLLARDARIGRQGYAVTAVFLAAIKYAIDSSIARLIFHREWAPWDYLISGTTFNSLLRGDAERRFFLTMLGVSMPFVLVGVCLTLARLRSAGLRPLLVLLFFMPVLNLLLFVILAIVPPVPAVELLDVQPTSPPPPPPNPSPGVLSYGTDDPTAFQQLVARELPSSRGAALAMSVLITVPFVLLMTWLSVEVFQSYGWGVFVGLPFICGLMSSLLYGLRTRRSRGESVGVAVLTCILATAAMFGFAIEGAGCLIMMLPLALPLAMIGGVVGHILQANLHPRPVSRTMLFIALLAFLPLFLGAERMGRPRATIYAVTTYVDVNASPQRVWRRVVSFPPLAAPADWMFRAGVAYPMSAEIDGRGVGAIRRCIFSTGAFIEPITVWEEGRLLKFDVTSNPPAMREWSPYDIHPPHIHDFLISHGGQFRLVLLPNGHTRLEGTTWYEHNLWPEDYWRLWSDFILHRIHRRVLEHVKQLAEAGPIQEAPANSPQ